MHRLSLLLLLSCGGPTAIQPTLPGHPRIAELKRAGVAVDGPGGYLEYERCARQLLESHVDAKFGSVTYWYSRRAIRARGYSFIAGGSCEAYVSLEPQWKWALAVELTHCAQWYAERVVDQNHVADEYWGDNGHVRHAWNACRQVGSNDESARVFESGWRWLAELGRRSPFGESRRRASDAADL